MEKLKASELRIGNYVNYVRADLVKMVKKLDLELFTILSNSENQIDIIYHKPISLSKNRFAELGFTIEENIDNTTYQIEISDGFYLEVIERITNREFLLREVNNVTGDNLFFLPKKYKYVHQLQNLYYALTGTEL